MKRWRGHRRGRTAGRSIIDGFSDGALPPKSAIREIRVNQNPFSAQYDRLGFGRVEVFTKPGQDKYHGQLQLNVNNSVFNSLNPFLAAGTKVPDYHSQMYSGNFGGPINKKSSFFLDFERRDISELSIVNATVPCAGFEITGTCAGAPQWQSYTAAIPNPRVHMEFSPRIDYQVTPNNTLSARYEHETSSTDNGGVGQYNLPSQANNSSSYEHNFRVTDTQIITPTMINETRVQLVREHTEQNALFASPQYQVRDTFTAGGSNGGNSADDQNRVELQNYTSKVRETLHEIRLLFAREHGKELFAKKSGWHFRLRE